MSEDEAPYKVTSTGKVIHSLRQTRNMEFPYPVEKENCKDCATAQLRIQELQAEIDNLKIDKSYLQGAMHAQDGREAEAGILCGVPYKEHGCDWPAAAAEMIIHLRAKLAEAVADVSEARDTLNEKE